MNWMSKTCRMALVLLAALGATAAPAPAPAAATNTPAASTNAPGDDLCFRNGDTLYGKLLEIQPGEVIRWQHADADGPIEFKPENVEQIDFAPRPPAEGRADGSCKLWLANGDKLAGTLVSCDAEALVLETWYAGKLRIARRALRTLAFNPREPVVFEGPTGLEGWTEGNAVKGMEADSGRWLYRNGAFYADKSASIARDVKLPARAEVQFDLAWRGQLNLAIALYTDSLQPILLTDKENGPDFGGFYSLRFTQSAFISLTPIHKQGPLRPLGDYLILQALAQKDRMHVDLRMSKADRRVALFLDGALVKDWRDPGGFAGEGGGVRFVNNMSGSVKMSNFRVARWNGVLEEAVAEAADPAHDVVALESGGKTSGAVAAIANGRISLLTTGGTTVLPLEQASAIEFARHQGGAPAGPAANTHATFIQGGALTFELLRWRPEGVTAASPDFGRATFDPAAFSRLQFLSPASKAAARPPD
jgi:hypothetical protein